MQRVVSVKHVVQLAYLEEYGLLIVLADKVWLSVYIVSGDSE